MESQWLLMCVVSLLLGLVLWLSPTGLVWKTMDTEEKCADMSTYTFDNKILIIVHSGKAQ